MAHDDICPCRHQRLVCRGQCEECLTERLAVVLGRLGTILAADVEPPRWQGYDCSWVVYDEAAAPKPAPRFRWWEVKR